MSKIALYIRLSVEDQIKDKESESIISQRMYLNDYLDQNAELKHLVRVEYVDDGYSGTNENRPSYQRLLKDVKLGQITNIVVKDMSRFMRDYITLGDYLENIFPFLGVRFIAINDGYDSTKEVGNGVDIDVQFKNLMYDFYAKDASAKVKAVKRTLNEQGKIQSWNPPYGYMKDPEDKHKIILDKETAWVVKKIYELYLEGLSTRKINDYLNEHKIITPAQRKFELTKMDYSQRYATIKDRPAWNFSSVIDILNDEIYIGTYVHSRVDKSLVNGTKEKSKYLPKEDWGRVYDNHEPIISKRVFEEVQSIKATKNFKGRNTDYKWHQHSPLQGFLYCPECGHLLSCQKTTKKRKMKPDKIHRYFRCRYCKNDGVKIKGSNADKLEPLVFEALKDKFDISTESHVQEKKLINYDELIHDLESKKLAFYEKYKLGKMTRLDFIEEKQSFDSKIKNMKEEQSKVMVKQEKIQEEKLTRDLMEKYVKKVIVRGNEILKIEWM
ncbi:MAG: recombinase family protein [Christensenellaceae bacterium]|nr:recombinase family protein [Christensenellaceae bacterium]